MTPGMLRKWLPDFPEMQNNETFCNLTCYSVYKLPSKCPRWHLYLQDSSFLVVACSAVCHQLSNYLDVLYVSPRTRKKSQFFFFNCVSTLGCGVKTISLTCYNNSLSNSTINVDIIPFKANCVTT